MNSSVKIRLLKTKFTIALFCCLLAAPCYGKQWRRPKSPEGQKISFKHDDRDRYFWIHVPPNLDTGKKSPVLFFLHGGGGNADQITTRGMNSFADRQQFIAVYPNAIDGHWNDGRIIKKYAEQDKSVDDVAFILSVLKRVKAMHNVDDNRVFAMGVSNGGFMTQRLAMEQSKTFSAAAVIIASMGKSIRPKFNPELPVSILFMNGTADPITPYTGGQVRIDFFPGLSKLRRQPVPDRGSCLATTDVVKLWAKRNKLSNNKPKIQNLPDVSKEDDSTVKLSLWTGGELGTAVALYEVNGGGHTIPGRPTRLPEKLVGPNNLDIDAYAVICDFFKKHARRAKLAKQKPRSMGKH